MEVGDILIIASREGSTPASVWSEDLCIKRIDDTQFELFIGGYGFLAETSDFYNEKTEEEIIPDTINGHLVQKVEDGCVFGGEIIKDETEGEIRFTSVDTDGVRDWLKQIKWDDVETVTEIKRTLVT
jgi:hypothetical protein